MTHAGTTRAEKHIGRKKPPTKRALKGAQKIGRQDQEVGVTSRARKSKQGRELVPDPRYGGRPGQAKSKWRPPPGAPPALRPPARTPRGDARAPK